MDYSAFDLLPQVVYIADIKTYDLYFLNKTGREALGRSDDEPIGGKCYKILQGRDTPCPFCNNHTLEQENICIWDHANDPVGKNYIITDRVIDYQGHLSRLELAVNITDNLRLTSQLDQKIQTANTLIACVQSLTSSTDFNASVNTVLASILSYYQGDRGYIFEFDWAHQVSNNTYERCAHGIRPEIQNLQQVPLDIMHFWVDSFKGGGAIHIPDISKLPEDRQEECETLSAQGITSLMAVPFWSGGVLQGFLGVDNPTHFVDDFDFLKHLTYFISNESEKRKLQARLENLSYYDSLTGIFNRNRFTLYSDDITKRSPAKVGVAFFDLNGLKQMNDTYGHAYGDKVIEHVGQTLSDELPEAMVFRMSGDEFLAIFEEIDAQAFETRMDALKALFTEDNHTLLSCGHIWSEEPQDINALIAQADKAMYLNKKHFYDIHPNPFSTAVPIFKALRQKLAQ